MAGTLGDTEWGAPRIVSTGGCPRELECRHERSWLWGASRPSLSPTCPGYLQGQLQIQVLRVIAEHSPRGAEEVVVHHAVLVLDVTLPGRGAP